MHAVWWQVLKRYDANGDGRLSLNEFGPLVAELRSFQQRQGGAASSSSKVATPSRGTSVDAVFRRHDKDNSGELDILELRAALNDLGLSADTAGAAEVT